MPIHTDEIDAIGTKRYDSHSSGEREIQRTMLELLNQLDGFDAMSDVKVSTWCLTTLVVYLCACTITMYMRHGQYGA